MDMCDKKLMMIKVPDTISRPPKSLHDFKRWKGDAVKLSKLYRY